MRSTKNIEIAFVGKTSFPVSSASSNRILSIAKGLTNAGAKVSVYNFGLAKSSAKKPVRPYSGIIHSIYWQYFNKRVKSFNNRFLNGVYLLLGQVKAFPILIKKYWGKKPIFFTSQSTIGYVLPLWIISRICGGKLIFFRSEFPRHIIDNSNKTKLLEKLIYPITIKRFDGMFLMTNSLKNYYGTWKNKNAFMKITPLAIDFNMFKKKDHSPFPFSYIAYCGGLSNSKDGLDILIRSFSELNKKNPDMHLVIIGGGSNLFKLKNWCKDIVPNPDKVVFLGLIEYDKVPNYLLNAKILALARPNSIQAEGGFPSKLGEYLATGNPVLVTNTGEITQYLKDKYNAILAEPNNEKDFTQKLQWLLDNPKEANFIGINGKITARSHFDMERIGKDMLNQICTTFY